MLTCSTIATSYLLGIICNTEAKHQSVQKRMHFRTELPLLNNTKTFRAVPTKTGTPVGRQHSAHSVTHSCVQWKFKAGKQLEFVNLDTTLNKKCISLSHTTILYYNVRQSQDVQRGLGKKQLAGQSASQTA